MIKTVYLDMDGVIVDFEKGCKDLGLMDDNRKIDWTRLIKMGPDFWSDLPWTQGGQTFYTWIKDFCKENKIDLCILSSGGKNGWTNAERGKKEWLAKNCPDIPAQNIYIIQSGENGKAAGEAKAKHATDTALLIDDFGKNVSKFIMAGGIAIKYKDPKEVRSAILELV